MEGKEQERAMSIFEAAEQDKERNLFYKWDAYTELVSLNYK